MPSRRRLHDPLQRSLETIGCGFRVFVVARHSPALRYVAPGEKAGEPLNVKQISEVSWFVSSGRYPAVVIHGLPDARATLSFGVPVTLLSAPGAALFGGCSWWLALVGHTRAEFANTAIDDILDCADASGLAVGALRIGQRAIVLDPAAPGWESVVAIAASLGAEVLAHRPEAIDMSKPAEARRLHHWLRVPATPGDSDGTVS